MTIRPVTNDDYPAVCDVMAAAFPPSMHRLASESLQHIDQTMPDKYRYRRDVLEIDGRIVGAAHSRIFVGMYHPRKFFMSLAVLPEFQRRGLGTRLYDHILKTLEPHDPICLRAICREGEDHAIGFLNNRGFVEETREWESAVTLASFDFGPLEAALTRVADQGITIHSLSDLKTDPDWLTKVYELTIAVEADMPFPEPYTAPPIDGFEKVVLQSPRHLPEAWFIARDGERWVGISNLDKDEDDPTLLVTDNTGVLRDHRRRGIAWALKLHGLAWAKEHGYKTVRTSNDAMNRPMLAINERLNFEKFPIDIFFKKDLRA